MKKTVDPAIYREYDIRGIYGKQFDEAFAFELARALSVFLNERQGVGPKTVTVGYDARLSSPALSEALVEGFIASGVDVLNLGFITTPMSYFSTFAVHGVSGAVMVTGSHNPADYNGFKISCGNSTIYGADIQRLREIVERGSFQSGLGRWQPYDIFPSYIERYRSEFEHLKPLNVVVDCGNGAAGVVARSLYEKALGLKTSILFEEPDGTFPNHHPDPTVAENLKDLCHEVKRTGAVAGIGFDGDADRIGLVDSNGNVVEGDELLALLSRSILAKSPGQTIVADVKCSDRLFADVERHGGTPVMWKSGHSLIKGKIKAEGAPFGGELSGHVFFSDRNYGFDDALYAGLRVLEILSETGKTLPELLADFPRACGTPEIRIDTTEEKKHEIVRALRDKFSSSAYPINNIDGIRVSFPEGWALARASNTQPVLVLRFEACTEAALARIRGEIESILKRFAQIG